MTPHEVASRSVRLAALSPLHAIVDVDVAARAGWSAVDLARAFLDGGARCLQLRAKGLASGPLLDLSDEIARLARACGALLIVNDRADVAALSSAAGVHVGQEDLRPSEVRAIVGEAAVVGLSTHSVEQIAAAAPEPATYIAVGPVFGTRTKDTGYTAVGLELVREASRRAGRPVVAIGGITLDRAASVRSAGADSVAVIGDLLAGPRPDVRVREFLRALR